MPALPGFAHQAVGQEEGKPLFPPNFIATGDSVLARRQQWNTYAYCPVP